MAERDIAVKFTGDASDLVQASNKAENALSDAGKSIGGSLAGIAPYAAAAGAAIAGVAIVGWDLAQAAMEDEAAAAQLAHQLRTAADASDEAVDAAEAYIEVLSKQVALADDELRPALATLATATGDVATAQELLALSTDIAAGTGKDLETVVNAVAKAQLGNIGGLSKLGLATKDASGETMTLGEVLDTAKEKFKGAGEAAAQTSAGEMKNAGIAFDELKEKIGEKLLPVLGGLAEAFTDKILPAGERILKWVEEEWPKIMEQIGPPLEELRTTLGEIFDDLKGFWDEWGDEITYIAVEVLGYWIGWIATQLKLFAGGFKVIIDEIKRFWAEWGDEFKTVAGLVKDTAMRVTEAIDRITAAVQTAIFVVHVLADVWETVKHNVGAAMSGIADTIKRPFVSAFNAIADAWNRTVGSLAFEFPGWIPGLGGNRIEVPDIPRFSAFGANLTVIMPPGSDGYDVTRQLSTFARTVADPGALTIAVR